MLIQGVRQRINATIAAVIAAIFFFLCGAILAFIISPQQAVEWRRIQGLPNLDASSYAATTTGSAVAITGTLSGNESLTDDGLVAYYREEWQVEPPDPDVEDDKPEGDWETVEKVVPPLTVEISGGTIKTLSAPSPIFGGNLHATIVPGTGPDVEEFSGNEAHPEGSIRTSGFADGDLITVVGHKGSTGDLAPDRLYAGDRVQLVADIRSGAQVAFAAGVGMMICAPIVLVIGVLAGIFGRRRGLGI